MTDSPENIDTAEASFVEEEGSTGNLDTWFISQVELHDLQKAINTLTRRRSICIEGGKAGRLSERAMSISEANSLARVITMLTDMQDKKRKEFNG